MKASQNEWADRKRQIAKDTETTIEASRKAIADALKDSKKQLSDISHAVEISKTSHAEQLVHNQGVIDNLSSDILTLEREKKVLLQTNSDLSHENLELKSAIKVAQDELNSLKAQETDTKDAVADLKITEAGLYATITKLETDADTKSAELDHLNTTFEKQKQEAEHKLGILEGKKQSLINEVRENQAMQDKVRENLANWQTKLDEKDKNLRLREARVNEQERSIARNYDLLNM